VVGVVVLAVSGASVVGIASWRVTNALAGSSVSIANGQAAPTIAEYGGAFNVLIVGEDNAPGQAGYGAARQATMNDVNILVHVAADHRSGVVLSIPRDLVIDHPQCVDPVSKQVYPAMTGEPLNTAFARGGLGCVVGTVQHLTGLTIPYAALFSFQGTVAMADAVGGVPVCVTHAIHDTYSGLNLPAGRSVITGRTALAYLRNRHGVGDGSDLARISSQQAYMSALMRKMTSNSTLTSPTRLYSLATTAAHAITLSNSLANLDTMVGMLLAVKNIPPNQLTFVQFPTQPDPANTNKVVPDSSLTPALLNRITADQPVQLSKTTHGYSTTASKSTPSTKVATTAPTKTGSTTPAGKAATKPINGLRGQTAAQETCSVAATG
jgi:LCP family protein required for cell wall assembly